MTETEIKAREQAIEIVNSYHNILAKRIPDMLIVKYEAKQCALIACDNTIAQLSELIDPENVSFWHGNKAGETIGGIELQEYWQSVRAEIEKL